MADQPGFFDLDELLQPCRQPAIRWSGLPPSLTSRSPALCWMRPWCDRGRGERPLYDAVLMSASWCCRRSTAFRMGRPVEIYLERPRDRLSFMRFVGLGLHQATRRCRMPMRFGSHREQLKQVGAIEGCSAASMRCWPARAFSPWVGRSSSHLDCSTTTKAHHRGESHHPGGLHA
jgi:hypothetical protein